MKTRLAIGLVVLGFGFGLGWFFTARRVVASVTPIAAVEMKTDLCPQVSIKSMSLAEMTEEVPLSYVFEHVLFGKKPGPSSIKNPITVVDWDDGLTQVFIPGDQSIPGQPGWSYGSWLVPTVLGDLPKNFADHFLDQQILTSSTARWARANRLYVPSRTWEFNYHRMMGGLEYILFEDGIHENKREDISRAPVCDNWTRPCRFIKSVTYYSRIWRGQDHRKPTRTVAEGELILNTMREWATSTQPEEPGMARIPKHITLRRVEGEEAKDYAFAVYQDESTKEWTVLANAQYFDNASRSELNKGFGHEIGHIVRPSSKDWGELSEREREYWQDCAESFSLKVNGRIQYRRSLMLSDDGYSLKKANLYIAKLEKINKHFFAQK